MVYNPGQFSKVVPFVKVEPDWLVIGGPADANEAQTAIGIWPELKILGLEPSVQMRRWQLSNGWPDYGILLPSGLSDFCGMATLRVPIDNARCSSIMEDRPGTPKQVEVVTLDALNRLYGPFINAILWLDIEGYEAEALRGAKDLFAFGGVQLVNVEILERRKEATFEIESLFFEYGFKLAHVWNVNLDSHHDRVYVRGHSNAGQ